MILKTQFMWKISLLFSKERLHLCDNIAGGMQVAVLTATETGEMAAWKARTDT
jgi:hypothetical protein